MGRRRPSPEPPRVPCKFSPRRRHHCSSSSQCPANPFRTDERTPWNPKMGRQRQCDPPWPHPAPAPVPSGHTAPLPRMLLGTKGCSQGWARGGCLFLAPMGGGRGWMGPLAPLERVTKLPPPCCAPPPSPWPCLWGARCFLLVNGMFSSARHPRMLACFSLVVRQAPGYLGGTVTSDSPHPAPPYGFAPARSCPGSWALPASIPPCPGDPAAPQFTWGQWGDAAPRGIPTPIRLGWGIPGDQATAGTPGARSEGGR